MFLKASASLSFVQLVMVLCEGIRIIHEKSCMQRQKKEGANPGQLFRAFYIHVDTCMYAVIHCSMYQNISLQSRYHILTKVSYNVLALQDHYKCINKIHHTLVGIHFDLGSDKSDVYLCSAAGIETPAISQP